MADLRASLACPPVPRLHEGPPHRSNGRRSACSPVPRPPAYLPAPPTAGLPVLRALLVDPAIDAVTVLARRPLPQWLKLPSTGKQTHPKLTTVADFNFRDYSPELRSSIGVHDACIWALGTTTRGVSDATYTEITVGYLEAFLDALKSAQVGSRQNPFRIVFVSGNGADPTETSGVLFARVKGIAENRLLEASIMSDRAIKPIIMRPAHFAPAPADAVHQRSTAARYSDIFLGTTLGLLYPRGTISTHDLAQFAVGGVKGLWDAREDSVFESWEMKKLVRENAKANKAHS
ncbi:hypothetical protein FA95DRAFT_1549840 [Auriscalpium vulgare]|uniref:Uncharacterized protein n=1 Tax=Auriscalpium vulgare TaxID=40419 RepID=A0ACB8R8B0_9AGAM|nr:hypothetical protein FA95DRAFT_1549840 [Auriscalpium vulgare]